MLALLKGIFMAIIITGFLVIALSIGAIGFMVFVSVMLGLFVSSFYKGLKKAGL